jgi:hypothetical protein
VIIIVITGFLAVAQVARCEDQIVEEEVAESSPRVNHLIDRNIQVKVTKFDID